MKHFCYPGLSALALALGTLTLVGCGGATNFPDSVASSAAAGPPISATVYGGHAPIVGAHVYLLQPSTTAYGGVATSLLGNNGATSDSSGVYTLTANVNDPHVPTTSPVPEYETTDSNGNVNLTGAYKCTAGQPVYMYAFGGSVGPTSTSSTTTFTVSSITVTNAGTGTNGTATYTFTINSSQALTAGQTVTVAGLNAGIEGFTDDFAILDGSQAVLANPAPRTTTFSITATDSFPILGGFLGNGNIPNGTYPTTGNGDNNIGTGGTVAVTNSTTNPATQNTSVVQLATLGNCPSSGNFTTTGNGALSNVFMNEVSTVATAYTFQPFTLATNNDAWHIGTTGGTQAQLGIANAADTAAQLYNIQGTSGQISTTADGDGHLANATTPNGNGTVPQAEIDTLADIIASCVDSTPVSVNTPSSQCSAIFSIATDNGETGGTQPTDTGTAVINIARYPDGNQGAGRGNVDTTYASDLFDIPPGTVPYTPMLGAPPNDWTLAITYTGGTIAAANALSPHNIAVDNLGNIYHADFSTNTFTVLNPLGVPTTINKPTTLDGPTSIALDSTSSNVWLANQNTNTGTTTVTHCTTNGAVCGDTVLGSNLSEAQDAEIDAAGNIWVTAADTGNGNVGGGLVEMSSATTPKVLHTFTTNLDEPTGLSIAPGAGGLIWVADTAAGNEISRCTTTPNAVCTINGGVGTKNENTAIDSSGNIWVAGDDTVAAITSGSFAALGGSPIKTGLNNINDGMAIDGNNTVWVANNGSDTVIAFSATNDGTTPVGAVVEVSPKQGYTSNFSPEGIAVDPSGNVWYDTTNGNGAGSGTIVELVGAGAPTVTPLSFAVANTKLGTKP
jgi:hypothetical protein